MMAESVDLQKGQLVFDNPSAETSQGSINSEQPDVQIRDGRPASAPARSGQLSTEQMAEIKRKNDQMEIDKYFALKVREV